MIGHPQETLADVQAIIDLSKAVLAEGRKFHGNKASVNVGVSTFIPKPHTPSSGKRWTAWPACRPRSICCTAIYAAGAAPALE